MGLFADPTTEHEVLPEPARNCVAAVGAGIIVWVDKAPAKRPTTSTSWSGRMWTSGRAARKHSDLMELCMDELIATVKTFEVTGKSVAGPKELEAQRDRREAPRAHRAERAG